MTGEGNPRQGKVELELPENFTKEDLKGALQDDIIEKIHAEFSNNTDSVVMTKKPQGHVASK
jgi:hypothetical protein